MFINLNNWTWTLPVLGLAIVIAFFLAIIGSAKKGDEKFLLMIKRSFFVIFILYFVADLYVMSLYLGFTRRFMDLFSLVFLAISHSFEIFIFKTHFFDSVYLNFFFPVDGSSISLFNQFLWTMMMVLALLAAITSMSFIIRTFGKRRADHKWLLSHQSEADITHIFLQEGDCASYLAQNIKNTQNSALTVLVGFPNPDSGSFGLSIWEKIKRVIYSVPTSKGPFDTVVYSRTALQDLNGIDIYFELGLKELQPYLENTHCRLYLLGDDEHLNFKITQMLHNSGCKAKIFCRACKEGANKVYEETLSIQAEKSFQIVDGSYLAIRALKNTPELLPVNFVDVGTNDKNQKEAWVASEFNSLIIGFGEIGREALKFLYEHAAFVDKDFKKTPFSCTVIDYKADSLEMSIMNTFPGMTEENGVHLKQMEAGSKEFWTMIEKDFSTLNYIVVCTGDDKLNLRLSIEIMEFMHRCGRDVTNKLAICVAMKKPGKLDSDTIEHYNKIKEYNNCLHLFASEELLWTFDNITNDSFHEKAKKYFISYKLAQGVSEKQAMDDFNERNNKILQVEDYLGHLNCIREERQDYANVFHAPTKLALIGDDILKYRKEIAAQIPSKYEGKHYCGKDEHIQKTLQYLAAGEHIRWEASHIALGFRPGNETNPLKKTHQYIMTYSDLSDKIQHYDYLVVKTTLDLK